MQKILTVSIAAYNVSGFLRKTLDSCIIPEIMDELEVLIVNDGSKDETADIAAEYEQKFPDTFRLINKSNGGYGSTVNRSMSEAKGKYFKLLDGDDWFCKEGLKKLICFLRTCEADLVLSGRREVNEKGEKKHSDNLWEALYGDTFNNQTVKLERLKPFVYGIWVATYRTEILKQHPFKLPEHQLYTDRMFICYPLPWLRTVAFQKYDVYSYRVGHEGQSVSIENRIKHAKEAINGFEIIIDFYKNQESMSEINDAFLKLRIARYYNNVLQTILMLPASRKNQKEIERLDRMIKIASKDLYECCGVNNRMLKKFRKYTYYLYWFRKMKPVKNWA